MSDSVLQNAILRRDAALVEAKRWDEFARMYCELQGVPYQMQRRDPVLAGPLSTPIEPKLAEPLDQSKPRASRATTSNSLAATEEAAIVVLTQNGGPMPTNQLRPALEARGIAIGGKDPNSTLSARLSRSTRLYNNRADGWWLKEKAGDDAPEKDASPASVQPSSTPVEPGEEVAHDNIVANKDDDLL